LSIVVVGIHERNARLELFEKVAVSERDLQKALNQLTDSPHLSEAVLVSTCMRTEIYAAVERFHDGLGDIEAWLRSRLGDEVFVAGGLGYVDARPDSLGGVIDLGSTFTCWYDDAAVTHLFEVTAGIDSPVLGEGEILRQVRDAVEVARLEGAVGPVLGPLFRHAIEAGKRVRSETAIQRGSTSLAHAVVEVAADLALGLQDKRILLVGAGEMGAGIARALSGRSDLTGEAVVANRDRERGRSVADLLAAKAVGLDVLDEEIVAADVVITSTASDEVLLSAAGLSPLVARRAALRPGAGPLVAVDVAVPRDIDPEAARLVGLRLADIEHVRRYAEEQMASRQAEIPAVRLLLAEERERYRTTAAGRLAAPVVSALRERAEALRLAELHRYEAKLAPLGDADRELVDIVTRRVVAKLLHEPTVRVKEAAGSPRGERLAEALRALFDL
jgi:glutamyl-tRNA reductase